jgi:hypothetical protein
MQVFEIKKVKICNFIVMPQSNFSKIANFVLPKNNIVRVLIILNNAVDFVFIFLVSFLGLYWVIVYLNIAIKN